jgi:very-short-patch-repair endonuclease
MAAVLSCGRRAVLSHESAAALWGIIRLSGNRPHVSVPDTVRPRRPFIVVHRRSNFGALELTRHESIPVTAPIWTLIDVATRLDPEQLEAAVNEADKRDLIDPDPLRSALDDVVPRPGSRVLRELLDRSTFSRTDSELERRFLRISQRAHLPKPRTRHYVNGFKVDFFWPDLELIVETDGLRYHRTPAQQAKDRLRDQAHTAAGLTTLRFTHSQVTFEPDHVQSTLEAVAHRLGP